MISSSGTLNVVAFTLAIVTASGFVAVPAPPTPTKCSRLRCSVHEEGQTASPNLTAVDFYSGIGGLRVALGVAQDAAGSRSRKASSVTVVESYDINAVANLVRNEEKRCASGLHIWILLEIRNCSSVDVKTEKRPGCLC